jgi:uncharacterized protein DUF4345
MVLARASLWLLTLGFAGFGAAYVFWPTTMAALTDIALPSHAARIDFAATSGGLQLGFATFLTLCARRPAWVRAGLVASGCALLGLAIVRLGGIWWSRGAQPSIYAGLAIEVGGAALAIWAARRACSYGIDPESTSR